MERKNSTVLITGASGIGLELAKQPRHRGNTVLVTGRDHAKLDEDGREVASSVPEEVPGSAARRSADQVGPQ